MSSPIHKASLVDASLHSPALLELLDIKLSRPVTEYVVDCVVDTVDYAMGRPTTSSRGRSASRNPKHAKFSTFVNDVLTRAEVTVPVILVALVYVDRAKPHLHIALEEWACERVFLGAIMLASKYLNDSTLKNVHWALCTGVFGKRDVGRIERELLDVLDFELGISEADILSHHDALSVLSEPSHHRTSTHSAPRVSRHRHSRSYESVPDLESEGSSSSSSSSSGSASPLTPGTPAHTLFVPPGKTSFEHSHHEYARSTHSKPTSEGNMDLLRSFPIPVSQTSRQSRSHHRSYSSHHQNQRIAQAVMV